MITISTTRAVLVARQEAHMFRAGMGGVLLWALVLVFSNTLFAQKALTNRDVMSMLEAGLTEETIVLAIHKQVSDFDTSPGALIELKAKGASPQILKAMLESTGVEKQQRPGAPIASGTDMVGAVYFVNADGSHSAIERVVANVVSSYSNRIVFGKYKAVAELPGETSSFRIKAAQEIAFSLRVASGTDPSKWELFALKAARGKRYVVLGKFTATVIGGKTKDQGGKVPLNLGRLGDDEYRVAPELNLPPGEYCFSPSGSNDSYCFGVDLK